jgi:hypothetical protein
VSQNVATARTSVWTLDTETDSKDLSDHIKELAAKVVPRISQVGEIAGVEGAYVDIWVGVTA